MVLVVSAPWAEERLNSPSFLFLDPRRPMKYLQGHLKNAVNLPLFRAFNARGELLPEEELRKWVEAAGLGEGRVPVVYDSYDGQDGAMLAWILEYLGCPQVCILNIFFERWVQEGREIFYKPVTPLAAGFTSHVRPEVRVTLEELRGGGPFKLVDFRSREEYAGQVDWDGRPGHIPGAVNVVWQNLLGEAQEVLAPQEKIKRLLEDAGVRREDQVVAYCRTGRRAAVGYLALKQCGYRVRLYDGSYAEWVQKGMPVAV